ncbi:MAG: PAS domain S-box protein [bacterium]|nr:PAS domain S-box protein [bacterium]
MSRQRDQNILEKLLLMQSSMYLMQDRQQLAEFLIKGLDFFADLEEVALCLGGQLFGPLSGEQKAQLASCATCQEQWSLGDLRPKCFWERDPAWRSLEVQTLSKSWGLILFRWSKPDSFEIYHQDLIQLSNLLGLLLESQTQKDQLKEEIRQKQEAESELLQLTHNLEKRVEQGMRDLQRESTERGQLGERLVETEWNYRRLVENLHGQYFFYRRDAQGVINYVSPSVGPLLGVSLVDFLQSGEPFINQSPLTYQYKSGAGWVGDGLIQLEDHQGALRCFEISESRFADELHCRLTVEGIARDVTEQRSYQQRLERERNRTENYLRVAGVVLMVLDNQGIIQLINPKGQQVLEGNESELLGQNWFDRFLPPEEQDRVRQVASTVLSGEDSFFEKFENQIVTLKGNRRTILWHNARLYENGEITGTLSSGEDVTERRKIENDLADSRETIKSITDTAQDAMILLGQDHRVRFFNPAACRIFGYSAQEAEGLEVGRLFQLDETIDLAFQLTPAVTEPKETSNRLVEGLGITQRGQRFPMEVNLGSATLKGENMLVAVVRDISKRKEREADLKEHSKKLAARNRALGVLNRFTLLSADLSLPKEQVYRDLVGFLGQAMEEPEAVCVCLEIEQKSYCWPEDHRTTFQLKEPLYLGNLLIGYLKVTFLNESLGQAFSVEEEQLIGELASRLGLYLQRLDTQSELRRLSEAVSQSPTALVLADMQGRIEYANPAYQLTTGFAPHEVIGKKAQSILQLSPTDQASMFEEIGAGGRWSRSWKSFKKNGEPYWKQASFSCIYDSQGKPKHLLIVLLDITEKTAQEEALKQALEAAQASNRAKSNFLATMSHELRTPMNGIIGLSSFLLSEPLDSDLQEQIKIIFDSGVSMVSILDELLDVARLEAGRFALVDKTVDLTALVEGVVKMFNSSAYNKNLKLEFEIDPQIPKQLRGDPLVINQIISNLMSNAVKFTKRGYVRLLVQLAERTDSEVWIQVRVEDTGIGIDPEYLAGNFELFSQEDNSSTRAYGGLGLGMNTVKQLLELMQGSLSVTSQKGLGSQFEVRFPLSLELPSQKVNVTLENQPQRLTERAQVLLVEDDSSNQRVMGHLLSHLGADVAVANNGEEALRLFQSDGFDLILMDCLMPVMDGYEATRRIRLMEKDGDGHLPILALTAKVGPENERSCLSAGMDGFLSKPLVYDDLYQALVQYLPKTKTAYSDP